MLGGSNSRWGATGVDAMQDRASSCSAHHQAESALRAPIRSQTAYCQPTDLCHVQHFVGVVPSARRGGQRLAISPIQLDRFIDNRAQLLENLQLAVAVATAIE